MLRVERGISRLSTFYISAINLMIYVQLYVRSIYEVVNMNMGGL